jgi:hypothetical protein
MWWTTLLSLSFHAHVSVSFHMFLWCYDIYYGMTDTLLSAACGTYVINLNVIIISEWKVIILYIDVILSALMCHCKEKLFSAANLYSDDIIDDVITIRENRNFHLRIFVRFWNIRHPCLWQQYYMIVILSTECSQQN